MDLYNKLKKLYKSCFFDELEKTTDLMFEKFYNRKYLAYLTQKNEVVSMGFLVKKRAVLNNKKIDVFYISGLCTKEEYRGQGLIKEIILKLMFLAIENNSPIILLNPFDEEYYKKYDFIKLQEVCYKKPNFFSIETDKKSVISKSNENNYDEVLALCNNLCKKYIFYQIFEKEDLQLRTDIFRYEYKELLLYDNGRLSAYGLYNENEIEFLICDNYSLLSNHKELANSKVAYPIDYSDSLKKNTAYIMGRIVDLNLFLEIFCKENNDLPNYLITKNSKNELIIKKINIDNTFRYTPIQIVDQFVAKNNIIIYIEEKVRNIFDKSTINISKFLEIILYNNTCFFDKY